MTEQTQDRTAVMKQRARQAVELAMASRWEEAISANRAIIAVIDTDVEAHNRLGKALSESGKLKEARAAYQRALELDAGNNIARKNLERLATAGAKAQPDKAQQVDTSLFIEEMGKSGVAMLQGVNTKTLATLSAGDEVSLKVTGSRLSIETMSGEYISNVEPKLALRLSKLMAGGNKYAAAVAGVSADNVKVIIKETFQDPSQAGRLSFPAGKAGEAVRPYTREGLVRADHDDEDELLEDTEEWEDTEAAADEVEPREESLFEAARLEDVEDTEFED